MSTIHSQILSLMSYRSGFEKNASEILINHLYSCAENNLQSTYMYIVYDRNPFRSASEACLFETTRE